MVRYLCALFLGVILVLCGWQAGRALAAICSGSGYGTSAPTTLLCTGSCASGSCLQRNHSSPSFRYCGCSASMLPDCCFLKLLPAAPWWGVAGACDQQHCPPEGACELDGEGSEPKPFQAVCKS